MSSQTMMGCTCSSEISMLKMMILSADYSEEQCRDFAANLYLDLDWVLTDLAEESYHVEQAQKA